MSYSSQLLFRREVGLFSFIGTFAYHGRSSYICMTGVLHKTLHSFSIGPPLGVEG